MFSEAKLQYIIMTTMLKNLKIEKNCKTSGKILPEIEIKKRYNMKQQFEVKCISRNCRTKKEIWTEIKTKRVELTVLNMGLPCLIFLQEKFSFGPVWICGTESMEKTVKVIDIKKKRRNKHNPSRINIFNFMFIA